VAQDVAHGVRSDAGGARDAVEDAVAGHCPDVFEHPFFRSVGDGGQPLLDEKHLLAPDPLGAAGNANGRGVGLQDADAGRQVVRRQPVVVGQPHEELATGLAEEGHEVGHRSDVARAAQVADSRVGGSQLPPKRLGPIGRGVVGNDDLELVVVLGQGARGRPCTRPARLKVGVAMVANAGTGPLCRR
jgi:hypothetical protein